MKVTSYAVARPAYYDRNAASIVQNFSTDTGPHGTTTRWSTTCAAGKKINVELANDRIQVTTVATTKTSQFASIYITSGATTFSLADVLQPTNTVGSVVYFQMSGVPTLYAGEVIFSATGDGSTGGTVQYLLAMKATSYDA